MRRDYDEFLIQIPEPRISNDYICIIVNCLTKSAYLFDVRETYSITKLAKLFSDQIIHLHEIRVTIILIWMPDSRPSSGRLFSAPQVLTYYTVLLITL